MTAFKNFNFFLNFKKVKNETSTTIGKSHETVEGCFFFKGTQEVKQII